jgi:predicted NBD/HSP70 family sugar kinase
MPPVTKLTAGVDLGGTKIQAVVLANKAMAGSSRIPTPQTGADDVIAAIVEAVKDSASQAGSSVQDLQGVGIGTPGEIDAVRGEVSLASNVPGFVDPPVALGPQVSAALGGVEVRIDNDVRVAILGEFKRGAGRPYKNLHGRRRRSDPGRKAPRGTRSRRRDRPCGRQGRRPRMLVRAPGLSRGLCGPGAHGGPCP